MSRYVSCAWKKLRRSLWKPNGVSERLYMPSPAMPALKYGTSVSALTVLNAP